MYPRIMLRRRRWPIMRSSVYRRSGLTEQNSSEDYSPQQEYSGEKLGEMTTIETKETSLIMVFPESDDLPSEAQLIDFFSRYGPLVEELKEVRIPEKQAHVVFKVRRDAETTYTVAGKSNPFAKQVFYGLKSSSERAKNDTEKEQ